MKKHGSEERPFKKAGIVIYGTNAEGKRAFVMPYSEGRFGYQHKYYALPKGSIDAGEKERPAAARETQEETGIDIKLLLGEENYQHFIVGEPIETPFRSEFYGIHVLHVGEAPVDHTYISRGGAKRRTALYGIEVEEIEKLRPHLKNLENANTSDFKVRHTVKTRVHDKTQCPQLDDFLEWLRTGEMPRREWSHGKLAPANLYKMLPPGHKTPFEIIEQNVMGHAIYSKKQWKEFCHKMPERDYNDMQIYWAKIKQAVQELGITQGDQGIFKLDDKDTPLQFFQEGADIITAEDYLKQCRRLMKMTPDYALAFGGGAAESAKHHPKIALTHSQLVAIASFVPPIDFIVAATRNGGKYNWGKPPHGQHGKKHLHPGMGDFAIHHPFFQKIHGHNGHDHHKPQNYWESHAANRGNSYGTVAL